MPASDTIEAQGHLIDSGLLSAIFDKIIEHKAAYEILKFDIARTNNDVSQIEMRTHARGASPRGGRRTPLAKAAEQDRCVPDEFCSTTNHRTRVRMKGKWVEVDK